MAGTITQNLALFNPNYVFVEIGAYFHISKQFKKIPSEKILETNSQNWELETDITRTTDSN